MTNYTYHTDAEHGWLEVSMDELRKLNIHDTISQFSYRKDNTAYLEEDCDMTHFLNTKRSLDEPVEIFEVHVNASPIRNYYAYYSA